MMLSGKNAVITGGTGVIGKEVARFFMREGCRVVIVGRSESALEAVRVELRPSVEDPIATYCADISNVTEVEKLFKHVKDLTGSTVDILVTAAGTYGEIGTVEQCDPENWLTAFKVNVLGAMLAIKYAIPLLKKSTAGKIITFAGGGEGPFPRFSSYASSKGAILRFTETVAAELAPHGIAVNAISPGAVASGLREEIVAAGEARAGADKYAAASGSASEQTVSPERAAELAVFLASDESRGLTGKNISAVWDNWRDIPKHIDEIMKSDVYNFRRIKPRDRGYQW